MNYSISKISSIIQAQRFGKVEKNVEWLLTDSRSLLFADTTLFFALKTHMGDGAAYIDSLYQQGVCCFVVTSLPQNYAERYPNANFLVVKNVLTALQQLAAYHRSRFSLPIVAVTGSNGKTIVKEWLSRILSAKFQVTRSPKSYNSQIGVPLSVWALNEQSEVGVFEAGISQVGEMLHLLNIIQPTIGVITNIGDAHQENFTSYEAKCKEKLVLFKQCEYIVYNADDEVISSCVNNAQLDAKKLTWSFKNANAFLYITQVEKHATETVFHYTCKQKEGKITIPFTSEASLSNAVVCLLLSIHFQLDMDVVKNTFLQLEPISMRLEVKRGINGCTIINDSYNCDLTSLDIALDFMNRRHDHSNREFIVVLSSILQNGMPERVLYSKVAKLLEERGVKRLIAVGEVISRNKDLFTIPVTCFADTAALISSVCLRDAFGAVILVKGARMFGFDAVVSDLEKKVHQTILEVNLNALVENVNYYRSFMKPETKMVCMVKASGYGAGSVEIARTLQEHHVDYLAVAVADEGAQLRRAGITQGIIIMNPETTAFREIFQYKLEPEVYSFEMLEALIQAANNEGIMHHPVHIKLDTGMHRLGFHPERDMDRLIDILTHQQALLPCSVFSHFVGSDGADFDAFTRNQFQMFDEASSKLQKALPHKLLRHICNTAGIARFPQYHLDMVRLGLGLYGIHPFDNSVIHTVSTLKTVILQIRDVPAEDTVGYSRRGVLKQNSRIAAIPIGYADGLNRHLGRGNAYCLVNGQKAYYVGNICMDVCMIDVTNIDCKVGDEVEIFGPHLPVTVLSDALDTIPYEVLTSVSERIPRVYYQD